jgi:hypothetical protein
MTCPNVNMAKRTCIATPAVCGGRIRLPSLTRLQRDGSDLEQCRGSPDLPTAQENVGARLAQRTGAGSRWSGSRYLRTSGGPIEHCRVEMWRGGFRLGISVSGPFGCRCLTGLAMAPFPHPAHQTGRAVFPHPAFGQGFTTYAASHVRPRTIAVTFVGAGIIPASGAVAGHRTVSFRYPAP